MLTIALLVTLQATNDERDEDRRWQRPCLPVSASAIAVQADGAHLYDEDGIAPLRYGSGRP
jgi:hypothetical protein